MLNITECLYCFAHETYFPFYLYGNPDYIRAYHAAERAEDWLKGHLDEAAQERLTLLADNQNEADDLTQRAAFLCGLSMGLELSRLGQLPG